MIYPSLIKIRSFLALADTLSFGNAAKALNLSQPALSGHIRDLEQMFGVALFHRTTRLVELTQEGANFLPRARRALEEIEAGIGELRDHVSLQRGRLVVACVPSVGTLVLPRVLQSFSQRYPNVSVRVLDGSADLGIGHVLERRADFGVGPLPEQDLPEIACEPALNDGFVALLPRGHALAAGPHVMLADLARFDFVTLPRQTNVRRILEHAFGRLGLPFSPVHEFGQYYTLGAFVSAGMGVSALPSMAARMAVHDGVVLKPIREPEIVRQVGIFHRRDFQHTPAMKQILRSLAAEWRSIQTG